LRVKQISVIIQTNNPALTPIAEDKNPWVLLIITLAVTMVGFQMIGALLGFVFVFPFYDGSLMDFISEVSNPVNKDHLRVPLIIMQGIGSFTGFILFPWILMKYIYHSSISQLSKQSWAPVSILLSCLIVPFFMGFNSPFIEWNQNLQLPSFMSGIESKLRAMENMLEETSEFITHFDTPGQFILGLVVIAVIPAIGEELVFRGLVQNHVFRISHNIHAAIWIGAFLFSAFHLQFYGLVPRMFLGVLFGYLYYFSGSLLYPMIAHFTNNALTLLMLYLYNLDIVSYNIEDSGSLPFFQIALSTAVTAVIILLFRSNFQKSTNDQLGESV